MTSNTTIVEGRVRGVAMRLYEGVPPTLPAMLAQVARELPALEAIVFKDVRWTYAEFAERVERTAAVLARQFRIQRGDRLAILTGNSADFPVAFFAAVALGAIAVPLNNRWKAEELRYALDDSGARGLILHPEFYEELQRVRPHLQALEYVFLTSGVREEGTIPFDGGLAGSGKPPVVPLEPDDVAGIFYTSGTTGFPKGAMTTHRNFITNCENARRVLELKTGTLRNLIAAPLFHATACHSQLVATIYVGGTSVILREYKADRVLDLIPAERITMIVGVPTMHWLLLVNPRFSTTDLSSITTVAYGGAPCPPELIRNLKKAFPQARLGNGFGLTETSSISTFLPHELCETKSDSVGRAAPVVDLRIVDDVGRELPYGAVGEIWIKGPNVVAGYWRKPEATAESFSDGWLHSGDVGKFDEDGCLYVLDRKKDMIIRGGENIYCVEVENAIYAHPKVLEAAVVGVPDEVFGEQVKAVVVPKPGQTLTENELRAWMKDQLADYKAPKYWVIQPTPLPRNPAGKVLKPSLRGPQPSKG